MTYFLLAAAGLTGIFLRYHLDKTTAFPADQFNWTTFAINVCGSLIAGLIFVLSEKQQWPKPVQTALLVGLCGGLTTFSTYSLQTFHLMDSGKISTALLYWFLSPVAGLLAVTASVILSRRLL
ncbi:CrcB family protein [Bdellovibrio bacteriovorus]